MENLKIYIDTSSLERPCRTIHARRGAAFVLRIMGLPLDIEDVILRVCPNGDAFYDFPVSRNASGDCRVMILGTAFLAKGSGWYEVRGTYQGQDVACGTGKVEVSGWSAATPHTLSGKRYVMTITDKNGGQHAIYAVKDDAGAWTYEISTIDADNIPLSALTSSEGDKAINVTTDEQGETVVEVQE